MIYNLAAPRDGVIPSPQPKGKLVGFKVLKENFSYYALDDGTVLGVKPAMIKVYRLQNQDGSLASTPDGAPAYFYQTQNLTQVLSPTEYKSFKEDEVDE
jgi:hypothetical protein